MRRPVGHHFSRRVRIARPDSPSKLMDRFKITGGRPLSGRVTVSGAKNSALPCLAAAILTPETVTLHNVPYVRDCMTQRRLLEDLGATVLVPDLRTHKITAANIEVFEAPYDLVKTMRASVLALGPLVARFGKAKVSLPGGCAIGTRPIDLHLEALQLLGAQVRLEGGYVVARAPQGGRLVAAEHTIIPDRIETGTFLVAAAITDGELEVKDCCPEHLGAVIERLREAGVQIEEVNPTTLHARRSPKGLVARDLTTEPYPEFPTDMQAQYMALMTQAAGSSRVIETIFENRFMHVSEMQRMGASIRVESNSTAVVEGPSELSGARVQASDLRASACLVLAGLAARGETWIERVYHIDRGYEKIEAKLRAVGADIERVRESVTAQLPPVEAVTA